MAGFFDSHCHINDPLFQASDELVAARQAGVTACLVVGTTLEDSRTAARLCEELGSCGVELAFAAGIHPEEVANVPDSWLDQLEELLSHRCCCALGEIGLDYHWQPFDADVQKAVLAAQLDLACRVRKPVIFHLRDSHADFRAFMEGRPALPGAVMHCFDGSLDDALWGVAQGWYVGFTGAVTFKKADGLRAIAASLPADRILSETDCPYMAPVPYRGKTNRPCYVPYVTTQLAQLHGLTTQAMADRIAANGRALFGLEVC